MGWQGAVPDPVFLDSRCIPESTLSFQLPIVEGRLRDSAAATLFFYSQLLLKLERVVPFFLDRYPAIHHETF